MLTVVRNNKHQTKKDWTKGILDAARKIIERRKSALIELGKK